MGPPIYLLRNMRTSKWLELRKIATPMNRDIVEDAIRGMYKELDWSFSHVVYSADPRSFIGKIHYTWFPSSIVNQPKTGVSRRFVTLLRTKQEHSFRYRWDQETKYFLAGSPDDPFQQAISQRFLLNRVSKKSHIEPYLEVLYKYCVEFIPGQIAYVLEKPVEVHFDDENRFHNDPAVPAVVWPSGQRAYYVHGVRFPVAIKNINAALIIRQQNQERKRVLLEHFGIDKFLKDAKAELEQQDDYGKLWRIKRTGGYYTTFPRQWTVYQDIVYVEVVNATPEKDGTYKTYFLRVPPTVLTAREGVAWTFNKTSAAYKPVMQT